MKKIAVLGLIFILVAAFTFGIANPEAGKQDEKQLKAVPEEKQADPQATPELIKTAEQNKGEEQQIQNEVQTQEGEFITQEGKKLQIEEQENNRLKLKVGNQEAHTSLELTREQTQEKTIIKTTLSNGKNAEIKVMPDTAATRAIERLQLKVCSEENNCQIELKEVGKGEEVKAAYEIKAEKQAKFLGLFQTKMQVQAQVDAENGEIIKAKKPWWAFLAAE